MEGEVLHLLLAVGELVVLDEWGNVPPRVRNVRVQADVLQHSARLGVQVLDADEFP